MLQGTIAPLSMPSMFSSMDRQLPSKVQQACEGTEQGVTFDELQAALKLSARGKKPDGLPYEFFSQFWEVLGPGAAGSPARCLSSSVRPLLANLHSSRPTLGRSVAETLQDMELRWVASTQPSSRGTARLSSETSASLPAWMTLSQTHRMHLSDRQQQRQEQHQQQQPAIQLPLDRAAADDIIDVLEACGSHPQQAQWRHIWESASASYRDRQHSVLWWRLLHDSLMCGAYRAYIGRAMPAQANCPFSCCIDPSQPQTISHLFITCPVAATVTGSAFA